MIHDFSLASELRVGLRGRRVVRLGLRGAQRQPELLIVYSTICL